MNCFNPKNKKFLFSFIIIHLWLASFSNETLKLDILSYNQSANIKDVYAVADISNGTPPFLYHWSNTSTSINSNQANDLIEGVEYSVTVTDSEGRTASSTFSVSPENWNERINSFFYKGVDAVSGILLMDIFAKMHLYDPVIYDENGKALTYPNGTKKEMSIPFIVVWLILGAVYFTIRFRFINFWGIKHAVALIRGKYDTPEDKGQINHFQALSTALSATVGLGNIAGVAIAISLGGPGATFWMIIAGFLGMASKFTEASLGVKYRRIDKFGEVSGGPMYYLKYAFGQNKIGKKTGKIVAIIFSVLIIGGSFGGGNMFQANQSFAQFKEVFPGISEHGVMYGSILAILVGLVIIGGINSIAKVSSRIVPIMAGVYIIASLSIIIINIENSFNVIKIILDGAFSAPALKGGFVGVLIMGFRRAAFSNEAGIGSAAIAHSAVKTKHPVSEGFVALLEPFIDTVIICTMTAFVLIYTGFYTPELTEGMQGSEITSRAFSTVFPWFNYVLLITIFLFAYSTLISWSYYGQKAFNVLFGDFSVKKFGSLTYSTQTYNVIFLIFVVVGASSGMGAVIDFSDMMILTMALPNILGLFLLSSRLKKDLKKYVSKVKSGAIKKYH